MNEFSVFLSELPPSENNRLFIVAPRGRRPFLATSTKYKSWKNWAVAAMSKFREGTFHGWTVVELSLVWPDRRRRDPSNVIKAVLDALVQARVLIDDDKSLAAVKCVKRVGDTLGLGEYVKEPGITVTVKSADPHYAPEGETDEVKNEKSEKGN